MIYVQTSEGLSQVSPSFTKEKIIAALGYTPADGATFWEDSSGTLVVADPEGYVIARIDENGLTTTRVEAGAISLNGEDLATKLQELADKVPEVDLTGFASEEALNSHIQSFHFSGNYKDLTNAPHIVNDNEDEVIICDSQGNIILRATAEGLNAANIYSNGESVVTQSSLNSGYSLSGKKVLILGDSINYGSSWNNGFANILLEEYPGAEVLNSAQSGKTLANNQIYSGLTLAQQNNFIADYVLINGGINDLTRSVTIGDIASNYDTASLDTTTMVGGLEYLISNVQNTMPNAKIVFFNTHKSTSLDLTAQKEAWTKVNEACQKYGIVYVDIFNHGNYNPHIAEHKSSFTTDGIHLTEAGYRRFWPMIKNALMNA